MLLAELEETLTEVIDAFHGQCNTGHHLCSVCLDRGGAVGHSWPVGEVDLGLGVHDQHPEVERNKGLNWVNSLLGFFLKLQFIVIYKTFYVTSKS